MPAARCDEGFGRRCHERHDAHPTWASIGVRARLRTDLAAAAQAPSVSTDTIAGHPVQCIDIPLLPAGTADTVWSQYCVLDSGVVARMARADVVVELTAYRPEVDDDALVAPTTTRAPRTAEDHDDTTTTATSMPPGAPH